MNGSNNIWDWENEKVKSLNPLKKENVSLENHESWRRSSLGNPLLHLYVGQIDTYKIGMGKMNVEIR